MLHNAIQTAIEPIFLGDRQVGLQQLPHGTLIEPLPVHAKLAARINQSIHHQQLQYLRPRYGFSFHLLG